MSAQSIREKTQKRGIPNNTSKRRRYKTNDKKNITVLLKGKSLYIYTQVPKAKHGTQTFKLGSSAGTWDRIQSLF